MFCRSLVEHREAFSAITSCFHYNLLIQYIEALVIGLKLIPTKTHINYVVSNNQG